MTGTRATPAPTILVVGATGATGRLLVQQLLDRGQQVRVVVRSPDRLPAAIRDHDHVEVVHASLLELDDDDLARHVAGCRAVASCLGHTLSFRGLFGPPRDLVTASVRRLCQAVQSQRSPSPSKAMPKSRPFSTTNSFRCARFFSTVGSG